MELNSINKKGRWEQIAQDLNENFESIGAAVEQVKNTTSRNKGYFVSLDSLNAQVTRPTVGDKAYVGSGSSYTVYQYTSSGWTNTGTASGNEVPNLDNYYTEDEADQIFLGYTREAEEIEAIAPTLVTEALRKTPQTLTDSEKIIARGNIGAANAVDVTNLTTKVDTNKTETDTKLTELGSESDVVRQNVLALPDLQRYKGWIDSSLALLDYKNSKYVVLKVKGGDSITKSKLTNNYFVVLSDFDYAPELPYSLALADGETGRRNDVTNFTLPQDAHYILLVIEHDERELLPSVLTINGVDITVGINSRLASDLERYSEYAIKSNAVFDEIQKRNVYGAPTGLDSMVSLFGHLDASNDGSIVDYQEGRHILVSVTPGDVIYLERSNVATTFAFVKDYDFKSEIPYTLNMATGSSVVTVPSGGIEVRVPSDAKYMILRELYRYTNNVLPVKCVVNGVYDMAKSWIENHIDFESKVTEKYYGTKLNTVQKISYLEDITKVVNGVSITCHYDGTFDFVGTGSSNGGRTTQLTNTFHLNQGTYTVKVSKNGPSDIIYYVGRISLGTFDSVQEKTLTIENAGDYFIGVNVREESVYNLTEQKIEILAKEVTYPQITAFDGNVRKYLGGIDVFKQNFDLNIKNIYSGVPGNNGMCTIDGILCSCRPNNIFIKKDGDELFGTRKKELGITSHGNDCDYCEYTDTLLISTLGSESTMALHLLEGAKAKLYSEISLISEDWLSINMPNTFSDYLLVGSSFGESCDIVYCLFIDKTANYLNTNKRLVKFKLGMTNGAYDGTYEILSNVEWPYKIEIQGSKYCNGKLYVSTDDTINTENLHSSITTIDLKTLNTVEHVSYKTQQETGDSVEAEGLAFLNEKLYQIVVISVGGDHTNKVYELREYDRFNL